MPPTGDSGGKPPIGGRPRLAIVGGTDVKVTSVVPPPPSSPPASSGGERLSLRSAPDDLRQLQEVIDGHLSPEPYPYILHAFSALANPTEQQGYDVNFEFRNRQYRIYQEKVGYPIELTVSQNSEGSLKQQIRLTYLPDGQIQSTVNNVPHLKPEGAEATHTQILKNILAERAQRIVFGQDIYTRMRTSLDALKGRYTPESRSEWFDNFVAHGGKVYTFRIRNLLDVGEKDLPANEDRSSRPSSRPSSNPQLEQISIYEESGGDRRKILTLSESGEIDFEPSNASRSPLSHPQIDLLKNIAQPLEEARDNPKVYQRRLESSLRRFGGGRELKVPEIARSVEIPAHLGSGHGANGEPILQIRRGFDLLMNFHPWAAHRWQNPEKPEEVRNLSPTWRMSGVLSNELLRWVGRATKYFSFENLRSPRPNNDWLRLHLFPEGGGQVTLYRDGGIYDIILGDNRGPLWKASDQIRQLEKSGQSFETRFAALQAAVAQRDAKGPMPVALQVQLAPALDLGKIHIGEDGRTTPIRTAEDAWRNLQRQIPEGLAPRVRSSSRGTLLSNLLPVPPTDIDLIRVDFRESEPQQHLEIRHHDIPAGEGDPIRRVEVFLKRGEDTHARVYEEGQLRPDISRDVHRLLLNRAQEGTIPRSRITILAQALPRIYGYYKTSGATYAFSYFIALPFTMGIEHLMYTPAQQRVVGTPVPRLSLSYFFNDFSKPFMTMSTASGVTGVLIDGLYNMRPGVASTLRNWQAGASLAQSYRNSRANFFNPSPNIRPIGRNFWFRGFLQRAAPLFAGLVALEYLQHGRMDVPRFLSTARNVGLVSLASAGLMRALYSSERLASSAMRMGLVEAGGVGTGASRWALTFRGGVALATLELIALSYLSARDRREYMVQFEGSMRDRVGQTLSARNELITRLEHGEEISPQALVAADQALVQAQGVYRRFLEMDERTQGTGSFTALGLDNDFQDEYDSYANQRMLLQSPTSDPTRSILMARTELNHTRRMDELRQRGEGSQRELAALFARYGIEPEAPREETSLRDFLRQRFESGSDETSALPALANAGDIGNPGARSPISVNSAEGELILEHWRWKAAQDPSFTLWSTERQANYLLRQFRGFQVDTGDGHTRRWNQQEAIAFLGQVHQEDARRIANMEDPLSMPRSEDGYDTGNLNRLLEAEQEIRARESALHTHAHAIGQDLAGNSADFDRQMESYFRMSNERLGHALNRFMDSGNDPSAVALSDAGGFESRSLN